MTWPSRRCTRSQQYYKEKTKIPKELQLWTLPMTRTRTKKKLLCFGNATPDGMVPNKDERWLTSDWDPDQPTTWFAFENTTSTASSKTTNKRNAKEEPEKINNAQMLKERHTGSKCMRWMKTVHTHQNVKKNQSSHWFLTKELSGTPHSSSQHHSSTDPKFLFGTHCNLQ